MRYMHLSEGGFQAFSPLGVWSRFSGVVKVRYGYGSHIMYIYIYTLRRCTNRYASAPVCSHGIIWTIEFVVADQYWWQVTSVICTFATAEVSEVSQLHLLVSNRRKLGENAPGSYR